MSWRFFWIYAFCLLGFSCLSGIVVSLQTGYALSAFSAEGRIAGIAAVSMIRVYAARIAALSACIGLVMQVHRCPDEPLSARRTWLAFSTLPLGAIVAGFLGTSAGVLIASGAFRVPLSACWKATRDFVLAADFGYGFAHACCYAAALGVAGSAVLPFLARKARWRVLAKLALIWVVTGVSCAVVDVTWELLLPADAKQESERGEQAENTWARASGSALVP